ncbi:uncharacterized protein LOC128133658 [Lactuca sativa]|uniref:uncharacterized protein LOC128133658 n=1 Tax=Lactuca sativa TaxID=4236 RepID=UPI0022B05384|nr:uncharacterized protein LOC128133658 [Lactuca sativa]
MASILDVEGYADWHHVTTRFKEHKIALDHLTSSNKWFNIRKRMNLNDKVQYEQFKKERYYWKQVLLRIIAVVKFLPKHNLAFRRSNKKLYKKGNGIFWVSFKCWKSLTRLSKSMCGISQVMEFIKGLFDITLEELKSLGLEIDDMRGQGYDNGANMKGKHQGESLVESVKAIKLKLVDIREALLQVGEKGNYDAIASEATSLAEKMVCLDYDSWIVMIEDVKYKVNEYQYYGLLLKDGFITMNTLISYWNKKDDSGKLIFQPLCNIESLVDISMSMLSWCGNKNEGKERELFIKEYVCLIEDPSDLHTIEFVEDVLEEVHHVHDVLEVQDKGFQCDSHEVLKVFCSIGVQTDDCLSSFDSFEGMVPHRKPLIQEVQMGIEDKDLKSSCHCIEKALKFEERSDIDVEELYTELELFDTLETNEVSNLIDVLKILKELDYFPNVSIAYRILLTIRVTSASAKRRFSKLKFLKSYLCSIMTQKRLSGLVMISIEKEILENIEY